MPLAIVICHHHLPIPLVIVIVHCYLSLQPANATCHSHLPHASCYCLLPLLVAIGYRLRIFLLLLSIASGHCHPLWPNVITICKCHVQDRSCSRHSPIAHCYCHFSMSSSIVTCQCHSMLPIVIASFNCSSSLRLQFANVCDGSCSELAPLDLNLWEFIN